MRVTPQTRWGLLSQTASSSCAFILAIAGAHALTPESFGTLAVWLAWYSFALGAARALAADPLLARPSRPSSGDGSVRRAIGVYISVGSLAGVVWLLLATSALSLSLLTSAITSVGLAAAVLQDGARYGLVWLDRYRAAAITDSVWAGAQTVILITLFMRNASTFTSITAAWAISAALGAALALRLLRVAPSPRACAAGVRQALLESKAWLGDFLLQGGLAQGSLFLLAAVLGLSDLGLLRLALLPFGLVLIFQQSALRLFLPAAVKAGRTSTVALRRHTRRAATTLLVGSGAVTLLVAAVPASIGEVLLGENWEVARGTAVIAGAYYCILMVATAPALALRAVAAAKQLMRARAVVAPGTLLLPAAGGELGGASGAAAGMTVSAFFLLLSLHVSARRTAYAQALCQPKDDLDVRPPLSS